MGLIQDSKRDKDPRQIVNEIEDPNPIRLNSNPTPQPVEPSTTDLQNISPPPGTPRLEYSKRPKQYKHTVDDALLVNAGSLPKFGDWFESTQNTVDITTSQLDFTGDPLLEELNAKRELDLVKAKELLNPTISLIPEPLNYNDLTTYSDEKQAAFNAQLYNAVAPETPEEIQNTVIHQHTKKNVGTDRDAPDLTGTVENPVANDKTGGTLGQVLRWIGLDNNQGKEIELGGIQQWQEDVKENPLNILKLPLAIASRDNKFGENGQGLLGGLLYTIDFIENTATAGITDLVNTARGRERVPGEDTAIVQAVKGRTYSIADAKSEDEPLGFVGGGQDAKPVQTIEDIKNRNVLRKVTHGFLEHTPFGWAFEKIAELKGDIDKQGNILYENEQDVKNLERGLSSAEFAAAMVALVQSPVPTVFAAPEIVKKLKGVNKTLDAVQTGVAKTDEAVDTLKKSNTVDNLKELTTTTGTPEALKDWSDYVDTPRTLEDRVAIAKADGTVNVNTPPSEVAPSRLQDVEYYGKPVSPFDAEIANVNPATPQPPKSIDSTLQKFYEASNRLNEVDPLDIEQTSVITRELDEAINTLADPTKLDLNDANTLEAVNQTLPDNMRVTSEVGKKELSNYLVQKKEFNSVSAELSELEAKYNQQLKLVQDKSQLVEATDNVGRRPPTPDTESNVLPIEKFPSPSRLPDRPVDNLSQTVNQDLWFHGTTFEDVDLRNIDPVAGSARHELGTGIYLTKNQGHAEIFSKASPHDNLPNAHLRDTGVVNQGNIYALTTDVRQTLDSSLPVPNSDVINRGFAVAGYDELIGKFDDTPYNKLFDEIDDYLFNRLDETERLDLQRHISHQLRLEGYDAILSADKNTLVLLGNRSSNSISDLTLAGTTNIANEVDAAVNRMNANVLLKQQYPNSKFADVTLAESQFEVQIRSTRQLEKRLVEVKRQARLAGEELARATTKLEKVSSIEADRAATELNLLWDTPTVNKTDDIPKPTSINERVKAATARVEESKRRYRSVEAKRNAELAKQQIITDESFMGSVGRLAVLKPRDKGRVSEFLSNMFGQHANRWGLGTKADDLSQAGTVRQNFIDSRRAARGLIDIEVKHRAARQVESLVDNIRSLATQRKIVQLKNYKAMDGFIQRVIEVGNIPMKNVGLQLHDAGRAYNQKRFEHLVSDMKSMGFNDKDIAQILRESNKISSIMDEIRALAVSLGADIGDTDGLGYFTRVMQPDAKRFIKQSAKEQKALVNLGSSSGAVKNSHDVSRRTFHYIPEDKILLAHKLGVSDMNEMDKLIFDGRLLVDKLDELHPDKLDELVDSGILSKVPMTTDEVFNFIKSKYELPMKELDEVFVTSPEDAMRLYTDSLKEGVSNPAFGKLMVGEGVDNGWLLGRKEFDLLAKQSPEDYNLKNFRRLDTETLQELLPTYDGGTLYVHRVVNDSLKSIIEIGRSPSKMGVLGQATGYWLGLFTQSLLLSPQYVMRVLYGNIIQLAAAGGDIGRYLPASLELSQVQKKGLDALDNTKKMYQVRPGEYVTKRQLFKEFVKKTPTDIAPGSVGLKPGQTRKSVKNILNIGTNVRRGSNYILNYAKNYGLLESVGYTGELLKRGQGNLFAPLANAATFTEVSAKWALIQDLLSIEKVNGGQVISSLGQRRKLDSLEGAIRHAEDYFFAGDAVGSATRKIGGVIPFAGYMMSNPPAQVRNLLRNPRPFTNYWRIRSFINAESARDENFIEANVPTYVFENAPLFPIQDDDGNWVYIMTRSFDPIIDGLMSVQEIGDAANGGFYGTSGQQRRKATERPGLVDVIGKAFSRTHPLFQTLVSIATKTDVETGKPLEFNAAKEKETFLGIRVTPFQKYMLSAYAPLSTLDRWNPAGIFGTPEIKNPKTGEVIQPGTESIFGEPRKADSQIDKFGRGKYSMLVRVSGYFGLNVKIADQVRNTQWTLRDIDRSRTDLKREVSSLRTDLIETKDKTTGEYQRRVREYHRLLEIQAHFEMDYLRLSKWANERGIPQDAVLEKYFRNKISRSNIDVLNAEEKQEILKGVAEMYID